MDAMQPGHDVDFRKVYLAQTCRGVATYGGYRYMKGKGFFGRLLTSGIMPLVSKILPFLKDAADSAVTSFARDIADGRNLKEAGKRTLKRSAANVLDKVSSKLKQEGQGISEEKEKLQR